MTTSRLLVLGLLALLCWPTVADAQQSRRDRAEQRIREACGDDRDCAQRMRDEMRQRQQPDPAPSADRPGDPAAGGALPARAQAAFDALPPDVQREMLERCKDDRACLRQAMRRYRQQSGDAPAPTAGQPGLRTRPGATPPLLDSAAARPRSLPGVLPTGETAQERTRVPSERVRTGQAPLETPRAGGGGTPAPPPPGANPQPRPGVLGSGPPIVTTNRPRPGLPQPGVDDEPEASPTPSTPTSTYFFYGDASTTSISGYGGTWDESRQPGNGAFLWGIESQEKSDGPCAWRFLWFRDNDRDVTQGYFATTLNECGSSVSWRDEYAARETHAAIPVIESPDDDDVRAVKSLQVCMNRDDDRIKGIRVWGAHIREDGTIDSDDGLDGEFERSNCHDWSTERTCPSGEVAVGVEVDFQNSHDILHGSTPGASGMRLICADPYTETD